MFLIKGDYPSYKATFLLQKGLTYKRGATGLLFFVTKVKLKCRLIWSINVFILNIEEYSSSQHDEKMVIF